MIEALKFSGVVVVVVGMVVGATWQVAQYSMSRRNGYVSSKELELLRGIVFLKVAKEDCVKQHEDNNKRFDTLFTKADVQTEILSEVRESVAFIKGKVS